MTVSLAAPHMSDWTSLRTKEWKTSTGYRVTAHYGDDRLFRFVVTAPRYRRRPSPVRVVCPECGEEYWRGDTESSANHRRTHLKRIRYLRPAPHRKILELGMPSVGYQLVDYSSPPWMHKEMYERALLFRREFGFDFVQWGSRTSSDDLTAEGYLFVNDVGAIVGAASFRLRRFKGQRYRALQWIWVAPIHRRTGVLTRIWGALKARYGAFYVEPPVSDAMTEFLTARHEDWLMDVSKVLEAQPRSIR